jgi:hypothetical protein
VTYDPNEIVGWVPPGAPGNPTAAAFPIYATPPTSTPPETPEARAARDAREEEAHRKYVETREQILAGINAATDPIERLVRTIWAFTHYTPAHRLPGNDAKISCDPEMLSQFLPDLFPVGQPISLGTHPPWDHEEIAQWFLRSVKGQPPMPAMRFEKKGLFGYKERQKPGWSFINGSTFWVDRGDGGNFLHVAVTADGDVIYGTVLEPRGPREGFNAHALREMARHCGLTPKKVRTIVPPSTGRPYDADALLRTGADMEYESNDSSFCSSYDQDAR